MADLTESALFDPVYQLETTDRPIGGSTGIANRQAIQLTNRTKWLKDNHDNGAYFGSNFVVLNSGANAVTNAMAGRVLRSFNGTAAVTANLPALSSFPEGKTLYFVNAAEIVPASGNLTVATNGSDTIGGFYFGPTSIVLRPGEGLAIARVGVFWMVINRYSINGDYEAAGNIVVSARSGAPTGYIACNGAVVSRTAYSTLFASIGTAFGAGDGVTTFGIPDLRGVFVRGLDAGRGIDAGRTLTNVTQSDEFASHQHSLLGTHMTVGSGGATVFALNSNGGSSYNASYTLANGSTETRPINVALNYFIKF